MTHPIYMGHSLVSESAHYLHSCPPKEHTETAVQVVKATFGTDVALTDDGRSSSKKKDYTEYDRDLGRTKSGREVTMYELFP